MTKRLDPARDDAGVRLRTARLRRGMTQIALAEMACVSASFVSMVETGQRELTRVCDIVALADVLRVSPLYLADGWEDAPWRRDSGRPGRCRSRLAVIRSRWPGTSSSPLSSSSSPGRTAVAAGDWLRRLARQPGVHPWLLLDQLATLLPHPRSPRK